MFGARAAGGVVWGVWGGAVGWGSGWGGVCCVGVGLIKGGGGVGD